MRVRFCAVFNVTFALLGMACHGQSPTAPGHTEIAVDDTVIVRSSRTGLSVAGAAVFSDGLAQPLVTTSDGVVRLRGIPMGTRIVIEADGFAQRITKFAPGVIEYIRPEDAQLPYRIFFEFVYGNNPENALKIARTPVNTIFPDAAFRNDRRAWDDVRWMVDEMNRTREMIAAVPRPGTRDVPMTVIAASDNETAQFSTRIVLDPGNEWFRRLGHENAGALAFGEVRGNTIVSALLVFRGLRDLFPRDHLKRALLHENTHGIFGFGHLPADAPMGIMGGSGNGSLTRFNPAEMDTIAWAMARPGGTKPVDDSTAAESETSTSSVGSRWILLCGVPKSE